MGVGDRTPGVAYLSSRIRLSISACFEAITHSEVEWLLVQLNSSFDQPGFWR